jgi:uncharacterized membrane protein YphA (DoxX/SURF4 family)
MGTATLAGRALLAAVFTTAALTKLMDPSSLRSTFRDFGTGERLSGTAAFLLPPIEFAVAAAILIAPTARWGGVAGAALLVTFIGGILNALRQGRRPDCGCFGALRPTPIGRSTLIRNIALLAVAVFVAAAGPGPAINSWFAARTGGQLTLTALVLVVAGALFLRALAANEATMTTGAGAAQPHPGYSLPKLGQPAPPFDLEGACGESRSLRSLCAGGLPLLLVFGDSGCGSCARLFPYVGRWQASLAERLSIAVVGIGDADRAREICQRYGVADVLVDPEGEVWRSYGRIGNPGAFVIAPDGTVANGPAVGQDDIEDLIRLTLHRDEPMLDPWTQTNTAA